MIKLDTDSILMRVVEHGWTSRHELELVTDTVIEQDSVEAYETAPGRLEDLEELFEYTGELRKVIIRRAVELREKELKEQGEQPNAS